MRRISIALLFLLLITPLTAFGQISNYGVKAGILSAGAYSDPPTDGRVFGFGIYGFTDIDLGSRFFSTIDLGITQRGFSNTELRTDETGLPVAELEAKTRLLYATFTPSLNINVQSSDLPLFFGIAPRFEILIDKNLGTYETSSSKDYTATSLDNYLFGVSVVTGIRKLNVGRIDLRLEAKYEIDISDSFGNSPRKFRNNALVLSVGVIL